MVVSVYFARRNSNEAQEEVVLNHSFKRGKYGSNTGYDALDVLPFLLKYEGKSSVGGLGPFEGDFGEGFNSRRPDRDFVVDLSLSGFGTPDETSEVFVSSVHLDREVELLEYLDGRWFICFLADVPRF